MDKVNLRDEFALIIQHRPRIEWSANEAYQVLGAVNCWQPFASAGTCENVLSPPGKVRLRARGSADPLSRKIDRLSSRIE